MRRDCATAGRERLWTQPDDPEPSRHGSLLVADDVGNVIWRVSRADS